VAKAKRHGPVATYFRRVLAERIRMYRPGQRALAHEIGVSESKISQLKSGKRGELFALDEIAAFARVFKMSIDQLFGNAPPPPDDFRALDAAIEAAEKVVAELKQLRRDRS
jgi:transcriptional regulator with XRE-family HTH domain